MGSITLVKDKYGYDLTPLKNVGVLVANWFDKEDIETLIDRTLTDEEFKDILINIGDDTSLFDDVSELVRECVKTYLFNC